MRFEWHQDKDRANRKKHGGIDFAMATRVFSDPWLVLRKDRIVDGEQRWHAMEPYKRLYSSWCMRIDRRVPMAKKSSASSRPGKQIRVSAESIWSKPLTETQKRTLAAVAKRQGKGESDGIDYSDIPALTDRQLAQFRRPPKKLVAVRLDADVMDWLRAFGPGYSTRINDVLRMVMQRQAAR